MGSSSLVLSSSFSCSSFLVYISKLTPTHPFYGPHPQKILTSPTSHLQFLLSLSDLSSTSYSAPPTFTAPIPSTSSSSSSKAPTLKPLGSLREPDYDGLRPESRTSAAGARRPRSPAPAQGGRPSSSRDHQHHQPAKEDAAAAALPGWKGKGKSKADVLRGWMAEKGESLRRERERKGRREGLLLSLSSPPPLPLFRSRQTSHPRLPPPPRLALPPPRNRRSLRQVLHPRRRP